MKKILIASFDMEIGGVEKSLIQLLKEMDSSRYDIDLMLYSHTGELLDDIPSHVTLLPELKAYKTFRMSIKDVVLSGRLFMGIVRLYAKWKAHKKANREKGNRQLQYMWTYAHHLLPRLNKKYDIAISFLWPHNFIAEKVEADKKIAWIHTDYGSMDVDRQLDLFTWCKFNHLMAVSDKTRDTFLLEYPQLERKVKMMENLYSTNDIQLLAKEQVEDDIKYDLRFKIVTVGRLTYAKGIDRVVEAMTLLKQSHDDIVWYVVGYGGEEAILREQIRDAGLESDVILLGKRQNPYPYMKVCDLYVQPSRYEGKALTVKEAQILGKPVLITDYATSRSQVIDGMDGLICEMSIQGIVDGISALYSYPSLRNELAQFCVSKRIDNNKELEKLYALF